MSFWVVACSIKSRAQIRERMSRSSTPRQGMQLPQQLLTFDEQVQKRNLQQTGARPQPLSANLYSSPGAAAMHLLAHMWIRVSADKPGPGVCTTIKHSATAGGRASELLTAASQDMGGHQQHAQQPLQGVTPLLYSRLQLNLIQRCGKLEAGLAWPQWAS